MINVIGPVNTLGYGYTTLNVLEKLYPSVAYFPIGQPDVSTQRDYNLVRQTIANAHIFDQDAPCLRIWHQHDMAQFVGRGLRVGFPIFELDNFSDLEKHHLSSVDRLFVCSHWAKQVIENTIKVPDDYVRVVPLGVDTSIFKPAPVQPKSTTIFFNCGKWEYRKGHDILAKAFGAAFTPSDDVELWLMCDNPFLKREQTEEWKNHYRNNRIAHKIRFIERVSTHEEVYNIMSKVDCGVFPARAEGWNLELLELMAAGKHVITTNCTAHTEFCTPENARLIDVRDKEPAKDGVWFDGTKGQWSKFDMDTQHDLVAHMRSIHKEKQVGRLMINKAGVDTARHFTWDNTAKEILKNVR